MDPLYLKGKAVVQNTVAKNLLITQMWAPVPIQQFQTDLELPQPCFWLSRSRFNPWFSVVVRFKSWALFWPLYFWLGALQQFALLHSVAPMCQKMSEYRWWKHTYHVLFRDRTHASYQYVNLDLGSMSCNHKEV